MLSKEKLYKINGHYPILLEDLGGSGRWRAICHCDCDVVVVAIGTGWHRSEKAALEELRTEVFRAHAHIVMEQQGWRCANCDQIKPLSAHHKVYRSHGRDDRIANLHGLCLECHEREHRKA